MRFMLILNFFMVAYSALSVEGLLEVFEHVLDVSRRLAMFFTNDYEVEYYVLLCFCHDGNLSALRQ